MDDRYVKEFPNKIVPIIVLITPTHNIIQTYTLPDSVDRRSRTAMAIIRNIMPIDRRAIPNSWTLSGAEIITIIEHISI
jgi:hypothetical protein